MNQPNIKNIKGTKTNQHGMTMIELVAALAILSIGVMGIVKMHVEDMRQTRALQEDYLATRLIENEWAYLQANPPQDILEAEKFQHTFDPALLREMKTILHTTQVVNSPGLLEVHLQVEWFSTLGRFKHKEATMLLTNRRMISPNTNYTSQIGEQGRPDLVNKFHGQDVRAPLPITAGVRND
jgi:prepilin-type N-terminal cleavage/methylation domain-containing protein